MERRYVEFYLTLITSGELTPRLFALKHGSRVFLGPKASGIFTLDRVPPDKAVVLIATGTGLAPYVSMLRTMLVNETQRRFVVLHGARYSWDLGYRGELESLARLRPNFTYIPSITRPDQDPHFHRPHRPHSGVLEQGVLEKESGVALDPATGRSLPLRQSGNGQDRHKHAGNQGIRGRRQQEPGNIHVEEYW